MIDKIKFMEDYNDSNRRYPLIDMIRWYWEDISYKLDIGITMMTSVVLLTTTKSSINPLSNII